VVCISVGYRHTAAVTLEGRVVCWGRQDDGRCNVPAGLDNITAVSCGSVVTAALTRDGRVICWGSNQYGQCSVPAGLKDVVAISARYYHVVALLRGGQLVCWGNNDLGQCDVPASLLTKVPVVADCDTELQYQFQQLTTLKQFVDSLRRRLQKEVATKNKLASAR
jgi:alpha-tubulin suppressor-like RCC1 family protein